jgi:hypothetical protein
MPSSQFDVFHGVLSLTTLGVEELVCDFKKGYLIHRVMVQLVGGAG